MSEPIKKFYVAGLKHHITKQQLYSLNIHMTPGLVPEPMNEHDPYAIKVTAPFPDGEIQLGYVPQKHNRELYKFLFTHILRIDFNEIDPDAEPWEAVEIAIYDRGAIKYD